MDDNSASTSKSLYDCTFSDAARQGPVENVAIEVGPKHVRYNLPKTLLVQYSEYFRKALNGSWIESEGEPIILEDVQPAVVNIFVNWLYRRTLPYTVVEWESTAGKDIDEIKSPDKSGLLMMMLYAFADRFTVPLLYFSLNRSLVSDTDSPFYPDAVTYAFNNLPAEEPILQFLVDTYFWKSDMDYPASDRQWDDELPREFLLRVMQRVRLMADGGHEFDENFCHCDYHGHKSAKEQEQCKDK